MRQAAPVLQANIWTPEHAMLSSVVMPSGDCGYRAFPQYPSGGSNQHRRLPIKRSSARSQAT